MKTPDDFAALASQFAAALPVHSVTLHIVHNQHRSYYQSARDYLLTPHGREADPGDFVDADDYERCLAGDELWEIQWYPNTPIGFVCVFGSTLARAMAAAAREGLTP